MCLVPSFMCEQDYRESPWNVCKRHKFMSLPFSYWASLLFNAKGGIYCFYDIGRRRKKGCCTLLNLCMERYTIMIEVYVALQKGEFKAHNAISI